MRNQFVVFGERAIIFAVDSKTHELRACRIDTADLEIAQSVKGLWSAHRVIGKARKWYAITKCWNADTGKNRTVLMHRLILGLIDPKHEAHHKDNDGLNNQRGNLSRVSHIENMREKQPDKDWPELDRRRAILNEYRSEKLIAKSVQSLFRLTRQAVYSVRRGRTVGSPAAREYAAQCRNLSVRPYSQLQSDHPVKGRRWGAVRVDVR